MSTDSDAAGEMMSAFPDVCADPGEQKMDAYDWDADASTWKLTDQAKKYRDQCIAELRELQAAQQAELAAAKAEGAKLNARLAEMNRDAALRKALAANGCDQKLITGAQTLLAKEWQFIAGADGSPVAIVDGMQRDVHEAVTSWLASDDGAGFRGVRRDQLGGFAGRILRTT